jgi:aryl-alcohol dehydrogenase-like predicted oxidoreductase
LTVPPAGAQRGAQRRAGRWRRTTDGAGHAVVGSVEPDHRKPDRKAGRTTMEYRRLGRTALRVSPICLGTMNFGPLTSETDSFAIMDRALELGINFFDTANRYGGAKGPGATEEIVGRWFAQGGQRREKVVIATKLYGAMTDWPNDGGLSARHIRAACDDSLRRLQTDHIDLYQMHHIDRAAPWDEVWQAMETLVLQGKIIYVGSSNFAGWHIAQANEAAKARHFVGLVSEQSLYNLASRTIELEVLPAARSYGLGVIPWSPLAGGMLGGNLTSGDTARRKSVQPRYERMRPQLERWEKLCADLGEEPAAVALAWLLHQEGVTGPIIGPRTMQQLEGASLRALDLTLDETTLSTLDEIFPGPGGRAPEAYAW